MAIFHDNLSKPAPEGKSFWILPEQGGSGFSCSICKSFAPHSIQTTTPAPHHSVFTGQMPFLPLNQQRQSTEGNSWSGLHLSHDSVGHSKHTILMASRSVQLFSHRWLHSVPILYNGTPVSPLNIAPSHGGSGPHLIHGSLGPPESSTQVASWSVQPFLQGSLMWQTDRQTTVLRR